MVDFSGIFVGGGGSSFRHTYWIQGNAFTSEDTGGNVGPTKVAFMIFDAWEYTSDLQYLEQYLRTPAETMAFFMQHYLTARRPAGWWPIGAGVRGVPGDCCVNDGRRHNHAATAADGTAGAVDHSRASSELGDVQANAARAAG